MENQKGKTIHLKVDGRNVWIHPDEYQNMLKWARRDAARTYAMVSNPLIISKIAMRMRKNEDNRKWAYIRVGHTKMIAVVDTKSHKAYKVCDDHSWTWMEWKKFKFVRWCTSNDL